MNIREASETPIKRLSKALWSPVECCGLLRGVYVCAFWVSVQRLMGIIRDFLFLILVHLLCYWKSVVFLKCHKFFTKPSNYCLISSIQFRSSRPNRVALWLRCLTLVQSACSSPPGIVQNLAYIDSLFNTICIKTCGAGIVDDKDFAVSSNQGNAWLLWDPS